MIQQSFWRQWTGRIFSKQWWPTHIIPVEKIWVAWRCILRACYVQWRDAIQVIFSQLGLKSVFQNSSSLRLCN